MKLLAFKKLIAASVLLSASLVSTAQADCTLRGYGVRVATFEGKTFLYFRTSPLSEHYYVGVTTDPFVSDAMYQGFKGKSKLFIRSKASTCPTIGTDTEYPVGLIDIVGLGY